MYRLINYFDVWGNSEEGYEINNQCVFMEKIEISDTATKKEIAEKLVSIGFLTTSDMRRIYIDDITYMDRIEICAKKSLYPLGCLEKII